MMKNIGDLPESSPCVVGRIIKGAYYDSVTLMRVSAAMANADDVVEVSIVMGTQANLSILETSGMMIPAFKNAVDADLIIAARITDSVSGESILDRLAGELKQSMKKTDQETFEFRPGSLEGALKILPEANLALISVAGRYAGNLAMDALKKGLHVMIFSDNVPIATERELKEYARDRGLLVMGPDCGTAIINGVPLGFANAVNRGNIGIVAAAGTGLQEVSCIISNEGGGISQAIGTGGHDLKSEVGGIMVMEGLKALAEDDETAVIVLISKPPDSNVAGQIRALTETISKPVVTFFLGDHATSEQPGSLPPNSVSGAGIDVSLMPHTLEQTARIALLHAGILSKSEMARRTASETTRIQEQADALLTRLKPSGKYIRGLFSGGTFCAEAQTVFHSVLKPLRSNTPIPGVEPMADPMKSAGHTLIDMGDDIFTVGRPHPMIDYSLRCKRILAEAQDPDTSVILLDVVLGYGSNPDPAAELADVISKASQRIAVICSVTGTDNDFQDRQSTIRRLRDAGAVVMDSNAAACRLALKVIS